MRQANSPAMTSDAMIFSEKKKKYGQHQSLYEGASLCQQGDHSCRSETEVLIIGPRTPFCDTKMTPNNKVTSKNTTPISRRHSRANSKF